MYPHQVLNDMTIAINYQDDEITDREYQRMKRRRADVNNGMYWFRGIKMNISVIASITKKSVRHLQRNGKSQNLSIQQYIKTLENIKYTYRVFDDERTSKPIEFKLDGLTITELSIKYNMNRSTIYQRYYYGYRTYNQLILGKDLRINGKRNYEHSTD